MASKFKHPTYKKFKQEKVQHSHLGLLSHPVATTIFKLKYIVEYSYIDQQHFKHRHVH